MLIAESDPRGLLQMVAAARGEFVVVQSRPIRKRRTSSRSIISRQSDPPLLACAAERPWPGRADRRAPEISAAQSDWASYANARFGTWLDYPSDLFSERDPAPMNNDGRTFRSRDGRARLSVHASTMSKPTPRSAISTNIPMTRTAVSAA